MQLLGKLKDQTTENLFSYTVVVADNDHERSAEGVTRNFSETAPLAVKYCVEPQQNIALARNRALQEADGNLIAFIDDDEFPASDWLLRLFDTYRTYNTAGVLGPVVPHFDYEAPDWAKKGRFFERPTHPTGYKLSWLEARTGNVLFKKDVLDCLDQPFRPEFGTGGEDVDFFRRLIEQGHEFVWCNEAVAFEVVPPSRCKRGYLLRRALLRGGNSLKNPRHRIRNISKSLIAVPCYVLALPILAVSNQHLFFEYLIRLCDHVARLFALVGLKLVTQLET
jgi:succinoglycan biosynthesis protein ExoM